MTDSADIAASFVSEHFDASISQAAIFSHVDIAAARCTKKLRRHHHKNLDAVWHDIATDNSTDIHEQIQQAIDAGQLGLYWCPTPASAEATIANVFTQLKYLRCADGYELCTFANGTMMVRIWPDR
jgi:hypothetical protein